MTVENLLGVGSLKKHRAISDIMMLSLDDNFIRVMIKWMARNALIQGYKHSWTWMEKYFFLSRADIG